MVKTMFRSYLLHFWADLDVLRLVRKPASLPAYATRFHTRTHSDLKGCRVCDAFSYTDTFRLERLPRMRCVSIRGHLQT